MQEKAAGKDAAVASAAPVPFARKASLQSMVAVAGGADPWALD